MLKDEHLKRLEEKDLYPRIVCRELVRAARQLNWLCEEILKDFDMTALFDDSTDKIKFVCKRCERVFEKFSKHDCY